MHKALFCLATIGLVASLSGLHTPAHSANARVKHTDSTGKGYICDTVYTCTLTKICYVTFGGQRQSWFAHTYYVCGPGGDPNATCTNFDTGPCYTLIYYAPNDTTCSYTQGSQDFGNVNYCGVY